MRREQKCADCVQPCEEICAGHLTAEEQQAIANFQIWKHKEGIQQQNLADQIAGDQLWEALTPLKGWAKVQAFINRVLGGRP